MVRQPSAVEPVLWRAVALVRAASLAYAAVLVATSLDAYARPVLGVVVLAVMVVWSAVTVTAYLRAPWRTRGLLTADVVVSCALLLATRLVDTPQRIDEGAPTLTVSWVSAPVLAWAVRGGWRAGGLAAAVVASASVLERQALTQATFDGVVLLLLAGLVVGLVVQLALDAEQQVASAQALAGATAERERLARDIHDGVLQVLALLQRRAGEAGDEGTARLVAEQEAALRRLVSRAAPAGGGEVDVRDLLPLGPALTVSAPGAPVLLPADVARELAAAVSEAVANVRRHVGDAAPAWLLLEDEGDAVAVTVRDEGPGIPPGRLAEAEQEGRLGVARSIVGRVRDLGGTVDVTSPPGGGTEVELRVPRAPSANARTDPSRLGGSRR